MRAYLGNNFCRGIQLEKASCETGSVCMVVRLGEDTDRTPQSNLKVERLELAVSEVRSELQVAGGIFRLLLCYASSLEFDRDTKQVLASAGYGFSPLKQ